MMPCGKMNIIGMSINPRTTTSSTRWAREPAIQSSALEEWWMAWKRHRNGTVWKARWMKYSAEIRHQHGQEELHQPGQAARRLEQARNAESGRELGGGQQDQEGRDLDRQMRGQEIDDVQQPLLAENLLLRIGRPEHLDRREDQRHEQHVEQEPVEADGRAVVQRLVDRNAGAAQQGRGKGKQHPGQAQDFLPAQHAPTRRRRGSPPR